METWRTIPHTGGQYEASDQGRIRSLDKIVPHNYGGTRIQRGRVLKPMVTKLGYHSIVVIMDGKRRTTFVHRLVCAAFHGECAKRTVNHRDGVKANNVPGNLEWATHAENQQHADLTGLRMPHGTGNGRAKLSEADVLAIRERGKAISYGDQSKMAREYGVTSQMIGHILRGANWKSLSCKP